MNPTIELGTYSLDESIDTLQVVFSQKTGGYVDEIAVPDEIMGFIWRKSSEKAEIRYIEIVNPRAFLNTDFFNNLEVNGYNIKELCEREKELSPTMK